MSQSRRENLMSQSQSLLEITESTHSRRSEMRSSSQLLRAASVSPQQCHRSCCAGQLCTAVQRQLDSTASTEKQEPRKSIKSFTKPNSSLCFIITFRTNVKEHLLLKKSSISKQWLFAAHCSVTAVTIPTKHWQSTSFMKTKRYIHVMRPCHPQKL